MLDPPAESLQHGHGARDVRIGSADEAKQLAFLRRHFAAADRAFDKGSAQLRRRVADGLHGLRLNRAHVDHKLAIELGFQQTILGAIDSFGSGIIK